MVRTLAFVFITTTLQAQIIKRKFYNHYDLVSDSASSYYYAQAKTEGKVDLSHPGWKEVNHKLQSSLDTVNSYYTASGKLKARKIYYEGVLNGPFVAYHSNGRIEEKGYYTNGKRVGYLMSWYEEGSPSTVWQYPEQKEVDAGKIPLLVNYWDTLGHQLITKGNGFCDCYLQGRNIRERGKVVDGLRDSVWTGHRNDTLLYRDTFEKGKFLNREQVAIANDPVYTMVDKQPEYTGGLPAMIKYMQKNLRYPADARRMGVEGKVFVGFIVNISGVISDVQLVRGVSADCDAEALKLISAMPPWKPGMQGGLPVRVRYVLPINFKLAGR